MNGVKQLEATAAAVSGFKYTGFAGHGGSTAPAEWIVTAFDRRGPADMPEDMPK